MTKRRRFLKTGLVISAAAGLGDTLSAQQKPLPPITITKVRDISMRLNLGNKPIKDLVLTIPPDCPECGYVAAWDHYVVVCGRLNAGTVVDAEKILGEPIDMNMTVQQILDKVQKKGLKSGHVQFSGPGGKAQIVTGR